MRIAGRCMGREGVGGFLESILAVMVVITASSVFLVVLSSGTMQVEENLEQADLVTWLESNGLYSKNEAVAVHGGLVPSLSSLPDGISGMTLVYRRSGDADPLLVLELESLPPGEVLAFQLPLLVEVDGRDLSGMIEVRAWR